MGLPEKGGDHDRRLKTRAARNNFLVVHKTRASTLEKYLSRMIFDRWGSDLFMWAGLIQMRDDMNMFAGKKRIGARREVIIDPFMVHTRAASASGFLWPLCARVCAYTCTCESAIIGASR